MKLEPARRVELLSRARTECTLVAIWRSSASKTSAESSEQNDHIGTGKHFRQDGPIARTGCARRTDSCASAERREHQRLDRRQFRAGIVGNIDELQSVRAEIDVNYRFTGFLLPEHHPSPLAYVVDDIGDGIRRIALLNTVWILSYEAIKHNRTLCGADGFFR
jgi:hypothetical protein